MVPTVGASPFLAASLQALRSDGGTPLEIVVVEQTAQPLADATHLADRVIQMSEGGGFTAANNRAIASSARPYVATVNDDAVIDPGWIASLVKALDEDPKAAAAQGVVRRLDDPRQLDGCGLAWNRRWQAIQQRHGERVGPVEADPPVEAAPSVEADLPVEGDPPVDDISPREIFGVSATVAVYRRAALEHVTRRTETANVPSYFDPRLGSYYEDVDLACRLRAAGWTALLVPSATARHAGSTSSAGRTLGATPLVYGNRLLVLAKVLGRSFWPRLPTFLLRDAADAWNHVRRGRPTMAVGIGAGWLRALTRLPRFARLGPPAISPGAMRADP